MIIIFPLVILVGVLAWTLRPGKNMVFPRKAAMLFVIIPALVFAVAAVAAQIIYNASGNEGVAEIANTCFVIGVALIVASIISSIYYAIIRKGDIARGSGFGACIAILISVIELGLLEWMAGV